MISSFSNSLCRGLGRFLLGDLRPGGRRRWKADACLLTTADPGEETFHSSPSIIQGGREME